MSTQRRSEADWFALAESESAECDREVTVGHTFCRPCAGAGVNDWADCPDCAGEGEHLHPDWRTA